MRYNKLEKTKDNVIPCYETQGLVLKKIKGYFDYKR